MKKLALLLLISIITYILFNFFISKYIDRLNSYRLSSSVAIELVYVAAPKDFDILPLSVKSVKKYLKQPISKIVLISPNISKAHKLAKELNMEFIDENTILNLDEFVSWTEGNKLIKDHFTWNWYYQQFLKLLYYKISSTENYLVVDSDVIANKPFVMVKNEAITSFYVGKNSGHNISKKSVKLLLGDDQFVPDFSFISDLMCFNKATVKSMISKIEAHFNMNFYEAALIAEQNSDARFSEYELYGVFANYSSELKANEVLSSITPNTSCTKRRKFHYIINYIAEFKKCNFVAFHGWLHGLI